MYLPADADLDYRCWFCYLVSLSTPTMGAVMDGWKIKKEKLDAPVTPEEPVVEKTQTRTFVNEYTFSAKVLQDFFEEHVNKKHSDYEVFMAATLLSILERLDDR